MPHILVKLYPGRSDEQKTRLADALAKTVAEFAVCAEKSVSVALEEVRAEDWAEQVYRREILEEAHPLYRRPGYNPFENQR